MLDCRILERNFQAISANEIGPRKMAAYASELLDFLQASCCYVVQERDEWTATVLFSSTKGSVQPFNPGQLAELTRSKAFFFDQAFVPRRALKAISGTCCQMAGLRLDNYSFRGWVLIGWQSTTDHVPTDIENALFRFGDKVLIHYLSLQRIAMEQQYRFIFSVVPQAVVLVNESDDVSWVNQAAIQLLNLAPDELRPSSVEVSTGMLRLRAQALNQDAINETAGELMKNPHFITKEWIWRFDSQVLAVRTQPIFSPYFKGRIWLFNDVTELYTKSQQLADANQEIENLISVIAHDLKSPLATLSFIFSFLPMHGPLNDEQSENIGYGQKTIKRGLNLIDSIVYFNKLITSNQPLQMTSTELDGLLTIIVDSFTAQAYQKEITLHMQKPEQPVLLHTDPESLVRILDNLISNALKFSPFGRNVYVEAELTDKQLAIAVRDEGPGISPDDRGKLFKRFQRLSAQPTNNEGSSGLGLSIVKALAEKLGAAIEVDSTLNVGTTFRVVFPAQYVQVIDPETVNEHLL
ncbi:PAS domain-containing sensor histidine kinase [Spirosoma taeanense]|uniref:histidine kinase n=1 Tax=Spirosoma taeanense TaxID=2735870 RepID=A0A6M5Y4U4_9BACT|nr:PAS domain-containing sensor histidine kinase [Spirosoma taeanense]QJW88454.1 PAS domain-containing sensor histidine kinase [Spirosoma taeanense]